MLNMKLLVRPLIPSTCLHPKMELDLLFKALSLYRRRRFEVASEECQKILNKNPYDQAAWCLKLRCLTEMVYVDEVDNDEEGMAEALLDDNSIAQVARPGTSLQKPQSSQGGMPSQSVRLGLYRDAEKQFKSAMVQDPMIDTVLLLGKVYARLDQPLTSIETYNKGLEHFPNDTSLLTALGRIYEAVNDMDKAVKSYKDVLHQESTNVEAIACIATNHFYTDQPEIALRYYRRLLQMGINNAELYTNIGLCCFYAQQFDLAIGCLERALSVADNDTAADVWYNIGHVALAVGDTSMAYQSFRLALTANSDHAEACCNLGVLEMRKGNTEQAKTLLQAAMNVGSYTFEPFYNFALVAYEIGDLQAGYNACLKSLELFPDHADSQELLRKMSEFLTGI